MAYLLLLMTLEGLKVLVVMQRMVANGVLVFCRSMEDCSVLMSKTGKIYAVLLGEQRFYVSN